MKVVITITGGGPEEKAQPSRPRKARSSKAPKKAFIRRLGSRASRFKRAEALSKGGGVAVPHMGKSNPT